MNHCYMLHFISLHTNDAMHWTCRRNFLPKSGICPKIYIGGGRGGGKSKFGFESGSPLPPTQIETSYGELEAPGTHRDPCVGNLSTGRLPSLWSCCLLEGWIRIDHENWAIESCLTGSEDWWSHNHITPFSEHTVAYVKY